MRQSALGKIHKIFLYSVNAFKYKEGIIAIEKIISHDKRFYENVKLLYDLGLLYDHYAMQQKNNLLRLRYENKALVLYQKAILLDKEAPIAWWSIGRIWWHRKNKKSIFFAKKAYNLIKKTRSSERGLYAQAIGLCYESIKEYKKAEYWLKKGVSLSKDLGVYVNLLQFYQLHKKTLPHSYLERAQMLFKKEKSIFKKTPWGEKIKTLIESFEK